MQLLASKFRFLESVTNEPGRSLLQFVTTNCLIFRWIFIMANPVSLEFFISISSSIHPKILELRPKSSEKIWTLMGVRVGICFMLGIRVEILLKNK